MIALLLLLQDPAMELVSAGYRGPDILLEARHASIPDDAIVWVRFERVGLAAFGNDMTFRTVRGALMQSVRAQVVKGKFAARFSAPVAGLYALRVEFTKEIQTSIKLGKEFDQGKRTPVLAERFYVFRDVGERVEGIRASLVTVEKAWATVVDAALAEDKKSALAKLEVLKADLIRMEATFALPASFTYIRSCIDKLSEKLQGEVESASKPAAAGSPVQSGPLKSPFTKNDPRNEEPFRDEILKRAPEGALILSPDQNKLPTAQPPGAASPPLPMGISYAKDSKDPNAPDLMRKVMAREVAMAMIEYLEIADDRSRAAVLAKISQFDVDCGAGDSKFAKVYPTVGLGKLLALFNEASAVDAPAEKLAAARTAMTNLKTAVQTGR